MCRQQAETGGDAVTAGSGPGLPRLRGRPCLTARVGCAWEGP